MGKNEFTIRDAQAWMGLSRAAIHRIFHGRPDRIGESGGLLSKCPALSMIETTVSEGTIEAMTRRRANHYLFDYEQYIGWNRRNSVWLAPDDPDNQDDGGSNTSVPTVPTWGQVGNTFGNRSNTVENDSISNPDYNIQNNSTDSIMCSQNQESAVASLSTKIQNSDSKPERKPAYDPGEMGTPERNLLQNRVTKESSSYNENYVFPDLFPKRSRVGTPEQIRERDYVALPFESPVPCHVCGKSPTTSLKITPGDPPDRYLCYECLKASRDTDRSTADRIARTKKTQEKERSPAHKTVRLSGNIPIPGILVHRDFHRLDVSIGKCDICGENEAMYRNPARMTKACERCYGRLIREGNRAEGAG
jgi:hypothetical protein